VLTVLTRLFMGGWYRSREGALDSVPYPEDAPVARQAGPNQIRLLLLGNGAASGWGVRSHELALTGQLARALARVTERGVQVDARVDRTVRLSGLASLLPAAELDRYDAVVLIAGMSDAINLTPLPKWKSAMQALLDRIREGAPGAAVLVLGPQPVRSVSTYTGWPGAIAERHRRALNDVTKTVCAERGMHFAILPAPSRPPGEPGHRSPNVYGEWAGSIAPLVAPLLAPRETARVGRQSETERQRATEALLPDAPRDERLDRITETARQLFGVEFAAVTLLDGDTQKYRSTAGNDLTVTSRASSMCDHTIRSDAPLVIGDLSKDPRFVDNPAVQGPQHLRFYAGYPIESPDGYRVGALCIFDTESRDPAQLDEAELSNLALLAQKELWAYADRFGSP
jgi:hypothetical protein